jgi:hypothetical protein
MTAGAADHDELEREASQLLSHIFALGARTAALEKMIDERRARLQVLLGRMGRDALRNPDGAGFFYDHTVVEVVDRDTLARKYTKKALAEIARPNMAFVKASQKNGIDASGAIRVGYDRRFKIEAARTPAARARQDQIIAETSTEMEKRIEELLVAMRAEPLDEAPVRSTQEE